MALAPTLHRHTRQRTLRRAAGMYFLVLSTAMIVTVVGLSAVALTRSHRQVVIDGASREQADQLALSAIDAAQMLVNRDPNWRSMIQADGAWIAATDLPMGSQYQAQLSDSDASFSDSPTDAATIVGIGRRGVARSGFAATLIPEPQPVAGLAAVHVGGDISIPSSSKWIRSGASIVWANGNLAGSGSIQGTVRCRSKGAGFSINGSLATGYAAKPLPRPQVFSEYSSRATTLSASGSLKDVVIAPGRAPNNQTNADGVYQINMSGQLIIENIRLHGTLLVKTNGHRLEIKNQVLFQPFQPYFPVLIVEGNACIRTNGNWLDEGSGVNFNPPGAPYQGDTDNNDNDRYPNVIQGVVFVTEDLEILDKPTVEGTILVGGNLTVDGELTSTYNSSGDNPPVGFDSYERMNIAPGSIRRTTLP